MDLLSKYDIIIFDCDGVIMDVNLAKCHAFGEAIEGYPKHTIDKFVDYCKNTFGVSRYVKFKEFFSDFTNEPFQEDKYNQFLNTYANVCKEVYENAETTPGCLDLLTELNKLDNKAYVASGSDEKELNGVFKFKGLSKYFEGIYGSPETKAECTSKILQDNREKKIVFIGDALSDMKTAKKFDLDFIYMSKYTVQSHGQDNECRQEAVKVVSTLQELL